MGRDSWITRLNNRLTEGFKYLQKDLDFVSHGPLETTEEGNKISLCSQDHLVIAVSGSMNFCI